ncbi:MAG: hypothetical protein JWM80_2771 [Cyanobacteria bacterium RYN_339]|nr:hypothetical protein [Cyanobacteria bacterium RYN_339]
MPYRRPLRILALAVAACATLLGAGAMTRTQAAAPTAHAVDPSHAFGLQYVPKFDEKAGKGAWNGTRTRGIAMRRDLGAQVSREGLIWAKFQPDGPQLGRFLGDFDDAINQVAAGGMACMAMVTESPKWASTATLAEAKNAPPRGLELPIYADGTDTPGPGKRANPSNTFAQALEAMLERYHGKIRYWQVWNEPDYPNGALAADDGDKKRSWTGSVQGYVRLLKISYALVHQHDPQARVVTGGLGHAAYLEAMLSAGAGPSFDLLDFHAYGWPGSDAALDEYQRVHEQMAGVLARHGLHKGLLCSETGYSSQEPQEQGDYVAKLYPTAVALGVESTMYYADVNPCWRNMGLLDWRTMSQKTPGYWAYKHAATALVDVRTVSPVTAPGIRGYRFERAGGRPLYVVWAPKSKGRSFDLAAGPGPWVVHDATGKPLGRQPGPVVHLALGTGPRWVDADVRRAYVAPALNPSLARAGLALVASAADSSAPGQAGPEAAIDTDADTQWSSGGFKQPSAWLRVALARPETVHRLRLKTGPMPAGTWFDVETSLDGQRFTPVATHQRLASWHMEDLVLQAPARASYVRLVWHDPARSGAHFSVFELEAY